MSTDTTAAAVPLVSVIMPVRNEIAFIDATLRTVLAQDYPADRTEILVVDGMSTDGTRERIAAARAVDPRIQLLDNPGLIAPTALNVALAHARGDYVVRIDGHCEVDPSYVRHCVDHLRRDRVDCVGGPMEAVGQTPLGRVIAVATSSRFGVGNSAFRTVRGKTMFVDNVNFPSYTRAAIERTGWFDEELVRDQDDEYNYRLRGRGGRILLAEDVHSRLYCRGSLRALWRQFFQYGYWKVRVLQKHPRQMSARQFVPPLFVAALIAAAALSITSAGRAALLVVCVSYLLAGLLASIANAPRAGIRALWLPAVFAVLHLSYGSGFLLGLIRFRDRWHDASLEVRHG